MWSRLGPIGCRGRRPKRISRVGLVHTGTWHSDPGGHSSTTRFRHTRPWRPRLGSHSARVNVGLPPSSDSRARTPAEPAGCVGAVQGDGGDDQVRGRRRRAARRFDARRTEPPTPAPAPQPTAASGTACTRDEPGKHEGPADWPGLSVGARHPLSRNGTPGRVRNGGRGGVLAHRRVAQAVARSAERSSQSAASRAGKCSRL